jgi:flagellar biosynthetic protein FliO
MALALAFLVLVVTACSGAPGGSPRADAPSATVRSAPAATSGEKDVLASLESADEPLAQAREAPAYVTLIRFGLSLALVLGLAYVTILGLKRFTGLKAPFGTGHGRMRVVENLSLGAGRALHLVEIGSRRLVVASTPSSVTMVTEIAADDLPDASSAGPPEQSPTGFKDQLAMFLGGKTGSDEAAGNVARILRDSTAFVQGRIGRLGSLRRRLRDAQ